MTHSIDGDPTMEESLRRDRDEIASVLEDCKPGVGEFLDVRLQVLGPEYGYSWQVHCGDAAYDTDHRGCWGAGTLDADTDCHDLADELMEQVLEMEATWS